MEYLCANKLVVSGKVDKFINDNIVENKIKFSNLIPVPNDISDDFSFPQTFVAPSDNLFLQFDLVEDGFLVKPHELEIFIDDESDDSNYYWWCRKNWGCGSDDAKVHVEYTENGAVLRFLTYVAGPNEWIYNLSNIYPELKFDYHTLTNLGNCGQLYSENNEIVHGGVTCLCGSVLNKMDCKIIF